MVRIRHILDPELRARIIAALAERRGCSIAAIPEWFELDDADYVDLLNDLKERESPPARVKIRGCKGGVSCEFSVFGFQFSVLRRE